MWDFVLLGHSIHPASVDRYFVPCMPIKGTDGICVTDVLHGVCVARFW